MLEFKSIKLKNFLSLGNSLVEFSLNSHKLTIVSGDNGAMKSGMFCDSVFYALYGKSFRKVSLANMINKTNKKELLVEIQFSNSQNDYKVVRGMKPNIFEIYVNGILKPQTASVREYQEYLTTYILKMDEKTFRQLCIIGSSSYIPFMNLSASERRTVIEDLLQIDIFSAMKDELKQISVSNTSDIETISFSIDKLNTKIETQEKLNAESLKNYQEIIEKYQQYKEDAVKSCEGLSIEIEKYQEEYNTLSESNSRELIIQAESALRKVTDELATNKYKINQNNKHKSFFETHDICPMCSQQIGQNIIKEKTTLFSEQNSCYEKQLEILSDKKNIYTTALEKLKEKSSKQTSLYYMLNNTKGLFEKANEDVAKFDELIIQAKNKSNQETSIVDTTELKFILSDLKTKIEDLEKKRTALQILARMLKDDGIKMLIIRNYLPIINKLIKKYLTVVGFPISFEFDEQFSEVIKFRGKKEYEYNNFSEGERLRIDCSILFAFRELSRLRSSISTNLLIADEMDRGVLDTSGFIAIKEIIKTCHKENILFVTHQPDELLELADRHIYVEKKSNFSSVKYL